MKGNHETQRKIKCERKTTYGLQRWAEHYKDKGTFKWLTSSAWTPCPHFDYQGIDFFEITDYETAKRCLEWLREVKPDKKWRMVIIHRKTTMDAVIDYK